MADVEKFDMVIVGAGFHGLSLARTHLQLHPHSNLVILDAQPTVGGVWATSRLYPGLKTNSMAGHFEFTDYPMLGNPRYPEVKAGDHIKGDTVRRYLEDYADKFSLRQRVRCLQKVAEAEDLGDAGWLLSVQTATDDESNRNEKTTTDQPPKIHASVLVLATGLTTTPKLPTLPPSTTFTPPIFHVRDFGKHAAAAKDKPPRTVVVLSANKSAADAAHHYATAGARVHWLVRPTGHGPCWLGPATVSPLKLKSEGLVKTRLMTFLHPCIWGDADGFGRLRALLHRTRFGRKIVDGFHFKVMQAGVEKAAGFERAAGTERLRPWHDIFWIGTGRGLLNYEAPDVFELVRQGRIEVHVADVAGLEGRAVRLGDGAVVEGVDALVCSTGWDHRPPVRFVRGGADISAELGVPHALGKGDEEDRALVARADREILEALPRLRDQPKPARPPHLRDEPCQARDPAERTMEGSYALYRFMVPPSRIHTRTLAFAGVVRTPVTAMIAEMQALWLSAFFSHQMPHLDADVPSSLAPPSPKLSTPAIEKGAQDAEMRTEQSRAEISARVKYESILHARYGLWRYPYGFGAVMPDFFFDSVPLFDLMGSELGLRSWRKANMVKEIFSSYGPQDYVGMVDEWRENRKNGIVMTRLEQAERKRALMTVAVVLALWITVMMCLGGWVWSNL